MNGERELALALVGRTRSGKRWFWTATVYGETTEHGRCDVAEEALAQARAAAEKQLDGRAAKVHVSHGHAASVLRQLNAERRRARPGTGTTAERREYLYGINYNRGEDHLGRILPPAVESFPILKKTARRIYYARDIRPNGEVIAGYIDRQALERDGEVQVGRSWWSPVHTLYAEPPELDQPELPAERVARLRREMADAHPDRGGTSEAFIAARTRYERALARTTT